jgi:hypothetical protein
MTFMNTGLEIWTVYYNPLDYPGLYVARLFILDKPTLITVVAWTLEEVRECLPPGLVRMERMPEDEPQIVECWF